MITPLKELVDKYCFKGYIVYYTKIIDYKSSYKLLKPLLLRTLTSMTLLLSTVIAAAANVTQPPQNAWRFGDDDKTINTQPEPSLKTSVFAQNPWLFDISNQYEDTGASEELAASKTIRQFSQNPWEYNVSYKYANHSDEISDSLSNLWEEGTVVVRLQSLFRNTNSVGSNAKQGYAYASDIFAQTGNFYGLSVGVSWMLTNPFFANDLNPGKPNIFIPTNKVNVLSQAFLQYTLPHKLQVSAGRISIDTPWINTTTNSPVTNVTFQGGLADIEINDSLYLTGLYVNAYKGVAQNKFTKNSMYQLSNSDDIHPAPGIAKLDMTFGVGLNYSPTDTLRTQLWAYTFNNYVSMVYAEGKKEFNIDDNQTFFFDLQGSIQSDILIGGESISSKLGLGAPKSKMLGAKITYRYNNIDIGISSNILFAEGNSFNKGGMISPYTYDIANDPLFTTSFRAGMVEKGGGSAFKVFSVASVLNDKLILKPSLAVYSANDGIRSSELNMIAGYKFKDPNVQLDLVYAMSAASNLNGYNNMLQLRSAYTF
ncbi:MAG: hypothetical protein ACI8TE_000947 [Francisella sp.]|jgi:hypothetical protein